MARPEDGIIGHLHLKTHDLGQARAFYIDDLGLEQISNFPKHSSCPRRNIITTLR